MMLLTGMLLQAYDRSSFARMFWFHSLPSLPQVTVTDQFISLHVTGLITCLFFCKRNFIQKLPVFPGIWLSLCASNLTSKVILLFTEQHKFKSATTKAKENPAVDVDIDEIFLMITVNLVSCNSYFQVISKLCINDRMVRQKLNKHINYAQGI